MRYHLNSHHVILMGVTYVSHVQKAFNYSKKWTLYDLGLLSEKLIDKSNERHLLHRGQRSCMKDLM